MECEGEGDSDNYWCKWKFVTVIHIPSKNPRLTTAVLGTAHILRKILM
jgi:hypothetical protein